MAMPVLPSAAPAEAIGSREVAGVVLGAEENLVDVHEGDLAGAAIRLHFLAWGAAGRPALLLLHGMSATAHVWGDFAAAHADRFHVIALDQRGHGDSGWASGGAYGTFDHMPDLTAVVETLGLTPLTIIGSSMGGRNALAFAACYPEQVTRLVVVDIGPARDLHVAPPAPDVTREEAPMTFGSFGEAVAWMRAAYPARSEAVCRRRVTHNTRRLPDGRLTWKWDPAMYARGGEPDDLWPLMPLIRCPTLVVRGAHSTVLSRPTAERMAGVLPDCRFVEIPDVGHNVVTDRPEAFRQAVDPFLAEANA